MGNQKSLLADITPLSDEDIARYAQRHRFSNDEVVTLHKYFTVIAGSLEDDGVIDMDEFQAALGFANSKFAERIFVALDEDKSERLEFSEFVNGFYLLSPMASNDEKVRFTFKIYDVDGNGSIDQAELYTLLRDVIRSDTTVNIMFSDDDLRDWVAETFREMCAPGKNTIELGEYARMVEHHPVVLQALTVPLNFVREFEEQKWERKYLARNTVKERRMSMRKTEGLSRVSATPSASSATGATSPGKDMKQVSSSRLPLLLKKAAGK